ncbi:MAG: homoprotocatechuate degradation operon regulator HpaR [Stellaceae bacterium]
MTAKTRQPARSRDVASLPDWLQDEARSLPAALLHAREAVMQYFRPLHRKGGITEQQWRVLRVLYAGGEMEATELARRSFLLAPSLSRILRDLEASGLLRRQSVAGDLRRTRLLITSRGAALVTGAVPLLDPVHREIRRRFGEARTAQLLDLLAALERALADPRHDTRELEAMRVEAEPAGGPSP